MNACVRTLTAIIWGWATPALAESSPTAAPPTPNAFAVRDEWPLFGFQVDVGAPDGLGVAAVWRPLRPLRASLAAVTYGAGMGMRLGLSIVPFATFLGPSLSMEAGHHFEADANTVVRVLSGDSSFHTPMLARLSYSFVNAQLGVELGNQRGVSVSLRAGLSYLRTRVSGAEAALREESGREGVTVSTPRVRAVLPSFKLVFLFYP